MDQRKAARPMCYILPAESQENQKGSREWITKCTVIQVIGQ